MDYVDMFLVHWPMPIANEKEGFKGVPLHKVWA